MFPEGFNKAWKGVPEKLVVDATIMDNAEHFHLLGLIPKSKDTTRWFPSDGCSEESQSLSWAWLTRQLLFWGNKVARDNTGPAVGSRMVSSRTRRSNLLLLLCNTQGLRYRRRCWCPKCHCNKLETAAEQGPAFRHQMVPLMPCE
jgi:hypothetical protein